MPEKRLTFMKPLHIRRGPPWCSWLKQCATSWKIAGWILMSPLEFFIDITVPAALYQEALLSLGSKGGCCVGLKTLPPSSAECFGIPQPQEPVQGLLDLN